MTPRLRSILINRRSLLALFGLFAIGTLFRGCEKTNPMEQAAPFVKAKDKWSANHLFDFLQALPPIAMLDLKKSQGLLAPDSNEQDLLGPNLDARSIQDHALRLSSNFFTRPFRDSSTLRYHETVTWVAKKARIPDEYVETSSTFELEKELYKLLFVSHWDNLTPEQRRDLLKKIDLSGSIADASEIALMHGTAALAALKVAVALKGFAFYTTMSATIATAASAVGVTLPFAVYSSASTVVGALSGPVGWAVLAIAGLGGVALAGRPNIRKTTLLIAQIHAMKIEALRAARVPESEIFSI